jgi:hypothetical protein
VPGNGTFNLSNLWQKLGIKNPESSMRETVQPVIVAGQLGHLTPRFEPATAVFGGDVAGSGVLFTQFQLTSRSPGGTLILSFGDNAATTTFGITEGLLTSIQAPDPLPPTGVFSDRPFVSLARRGRTVISPIDGSDQAPTQPSAMGFGPPPLWLPPGKTFFLMAFAAGGNITDYFVIAQDLEASEMPQA